MNSTAARRVVTGRTTVLGAGLLIGLSCALAGCSGSSASGSPLSPATGTSPAAAGPQASASAAAAAVAAGGKLPSGESSVSALASHGGLQSVASANSNVKLTPQVICGVVQSIQPSLDAANTPDAARLNLQLQLSHYFDAIHANPRLTGAALDRLMKKSCPAVRKAALQSTGKKAFADIL